MVDMLNMQLDGGTALLEPVVLPEAQRGEKVLAIRRQLAQGIYDIEGRLERVLDRLLSDIAERMARDGDRAAMSQTRAEKPG
ncbi:MAG: hypothetical protein JW741_24210 [Sedimentisphaerales bacterium]|nr:hypothetical protein [Sedimentisphaerales bacterium]